MVKEKTYTAIVSDRAKRMLASHIRFLANVSKDAAPEKKTQRIREIHSLSKLPHRYPFFEPTSCRRTNITRCLLRIGI